MQVDFEHINVSVKLSANQSRVWQALTTPSGITLLPLRLHVHAREVNLQPDLVA